MKRLVLFVLLLSVPATYAKNRDPKHYPQRAKVVSFQRQPCMKQIGAITRVCHVITFELEGRSFVGSCFRCDPLVPGETYPARLDQKEMVLYVIHQKGNGSWGQDDYAITDISQSEQK